MASSDQETSGRGSSRTQMDPVADTAGQALDEKRQRTTSMDDTAAAPFWAFILADILGVVLRFLPCLADRAAVRSVCRHWRAAARGHSHGLPPPLPLLVLPKFRFFSFSTQGAAVAMRRGWMPEEMATGNVGCVGSFEGWLLVARPCEDAVSHERFLVHAFSHDVIHLPSLRASYCTTSGELPWTANDDSKYLRSLDHVVLSAPPSAATKCIVAGFSHRKLEPRLSGWRSLSDWRGLPGITLWQPGMKTWYVYQSRSMDSLSDLVFHQGKLYILHRSWYAYPWPSLFAFTLGEDEHGVNVVSEHRVTMPPIPCPGSPSWVARCNLVLWHGSLVVIIRYVDAYISFSETKKVDVFALDLGKNPCGVTKIHCFEGDCVFVDPCRCTSFPAGSYEDVQGDCIYFIDKYKRSYATTVYSMRDCTVKPFTADLLTGNLAEDNLADALWMFPPE